MAFDATAQFRILRRYQMMFRTAIGTGSLGALLLATGVIAWMFGPLPVLVLLGLLLIELSGMLALKVAQSTARMLDEFGAFERTETCG